MLRLKVGHNLGFVRDSFLLLRAQLSIWNRTCTTSTTMAPTDRRYEKKQKKQGYISLTQGCTGPDKGPE